jgi:hypothetical protein
MPNIFTIISILLCVYSLTGCSGKPREVRASIPLVSMSKEKPNKKEIPSKYWATLSDSKQRQLKHDEYHIQLTESYISALGLLCRELIITDIENKIKKRVACEIPFINEDNEQDKAWFIEKEIIESSGYVEL